jgi:hypothetical protein
MQLSNYALSLLVPAYLAVAQDLGAAITSGLGDAGGAVRITHITSTSIDPSLTSHRSLLPLVVLAKLPLPPFLQSARA